MIDELLESFKSGFRNIPSDIRRIVYYVFSVVFVSIFTNCTIILVYFVLSPLLPNHHPTVKLNSVTVTSLDTQAVNLKATFNMTFDFNSFKCNDRNVSYSDVEVKAWWSGNDSITLSEKWLIPFTQRTDKVAKVGAVLKVADGLSNSSDVVKGISDEFARGSVNFGLSLFGLVRFEDDSTESLTFVCNPVAIVFAPGSNNGTWNSLVVPCPKLHRHFF